MALSPVLALAKSYPTIMSLDEELAVIQALQNFPQEVLLREFDVMRIILDLLYDSHTGGGIFEVADSNYEPLKQFSQTLRTLATLVPTQQSEYLISVALALEARF